MPLIAFALVFHCGFLCMTVVDALEVSFPEDLFLEDAMAAFSLSSLKELCKGRSSTPTCFIVTVQ